MNQHAPILAAAEPHDGFAEQNRDKDAAAFRSLALQLRRNGHQYRQWSREAAAKGQTVAAETFANRAARYCQDAIWYWKRSRL